MPNAPRSRCAQRAAQIAMAVVLAALPAGLSAQNSTKQAPGPRLSMGPLETEVRKDFIAVGKLNRAGLKQRSGCSGVLIREDVVLTAAHCAGLKKGTKDVNVFITGWHRGNYFEYQSLSHGMKHPAYGVRGVHDPRYDVGLLFLAEPMRDVTPMPMADMSSDHVALAGYHRLVPHIMTGELACPVLRRHEQNVWLDCPVHSGNSGGPVLEQDAAGQWQVTGVVSSQFRRGNRMGAIVVKIPQWVRDVLAETEPPIETATDTAGTVPSE